MRLIGEMLPAGDRVPADRRSVHDGPGRRGPGVRVLGVRQVVPMHWGTFPLLTGTPAELKALRAARGSTCWS